MRGVGVWQNVLVIGIALVVVPHSFRLVWNPVTLVALAPLTLLAGALACVGAAIYFGHALDAKRRHSRNTLRLAARPFTFSTPAAWQAVLTRSQWSQSSPQTLPPLIPDSPEVSAAINELIGFILRDFVDQWYQGISSSPAFPAAVASIVHDSLETLLARASQIDLAALIIKRILPKITTHIEHFRQSEVALRGAGLERKLTQSEELDLMLAGRYGSEGQGTLHPAISNLSTGYTKQTEENHLRVLVERALPFILPETEAESHALALVVREIVSCSVLHPVMEMLSDPDFWNRTIDQVAGAVIQQQRLVNKVRNVLEAQSPRRAAQPSEEVQSIVPTEVITIHTDPRHFESFLRSINRCSSLLDARRLKNDILGEIRRTRMLLANHEKDDWIDGQKTEDVVAFLDRLYTAKRKVEQRIVVLGGKDDSKVPSYQEAGPKSGITLRDILRNPNSLSYFMEFMDRRQRSLLVQFWLTVESFKNPLEDIDSGSEDDDEPVQDAGSSQTVKEDITMIHDLYFSGPAPHPALISISRKYVDDIREFARNDGVPSAKSQRRVRRSVMLAQRQVETDMEQDFEDFERSELWFRATTDMDQGSKKIDATPVRDKHPERLVSAPLPTQVKRTRSAATLPRSESTPVPPVVAPPMVRSNSSQSAMSMRAARKNTPVMDDLLGTPETGSSRAPLFDDPEDEEQRGEEERMDAIQAALTDILAFEQQEPMEKVSSNEDVTPDHEALYTASSHPARARKQRVLFEDDVVDEPEDLEPKNEEGEGEGEPSPVVHVGPGDLQLSYEIARLSNHMSKLEAQDTMLDAFVKKAELTGDTRELRILTQSKMTVNRELAELRFKKQQYEQQESANRLFAGRTKVTIVNQTVGEEDGKSVVRFLIEVQQLALDGTFASGWVVARRYNEFLSMHNKVREKYPQTKVLDFPGKRLVTALSTNFLDTRRAALEKYLQGLIAIPPVCEGDELRTFLSRDSPFVASAPPVPTPAGKDKFSGSDLVRNVYRSVATSIDDMIFGPSMLDVLIQRLTRQAAEFAGLAGTGMTDEEAVARALRASGRTDAALLQLTGAEGEAGTAAFAAPICDLILAVFELKRENNVNWLRRQAIVIILQQVLGGTVERKTRDIVKGLLEESRVMSYIRIFRDGLWPGGKLKPPSAPRSSEEKAHTRDEANRKLSSVVPDFAANMIGRSNARRGARRIFAVLQNRRLNQHIVYTVVDEVFAALFPEAQGERQTS